MEAIDTSQHCTIHRRDNRPTSNRLTVDAPRKFDDLHQIEPTSRSGLPCELFFPLPETSPQLPLVGRRRKGPRPHPLSRRDSWGSEGGMCLQISTNGLSYRRSTAEYSRGFFRQRAHCRFLPRSRYLRHTFYTRTLEYAVDCT